MFVEQGQHAVASGPYLGESRVRGRDGGIGRVDGVVRGLRCGDGPGAIGVELARVEFDQCLAALHPITRRDRDGCDGGEHTTGDRRRVTCADDASGFEDRPGNALLWAYLQRALKPSGRVCSPAEFSLELLRCIDRHLSTLSDEELLAAARSLRLAIPTREKDDGRNHGDRGDDDEDDRDRGKNDGQRDRSK